MTDMDQIRRWYDMYMKVILVVAALPIYFQAATIYNNQSAENVSLASYILFLIVTLSWMVYGVVKADHDASNRLMIASTGLIATIGVILAIIVYASYTPCTNPGPFVRVIRN